MQRHLAVAIIVALYLARVSLQQVRPKISEQFSTKTQGLVKEPGRSFTYEGEWAHDLEGERQMKNMAMDTGHVGPSLDDIRLYFYKEHTYYHYQFEEEEIDSCEKFTLNGSMPSAWGWVSLAAYAGTKTYDGHVLELWRLRTPTISREVGVRPELPNTPVYYGVNETTAIIHAEATVVMSDFSPTTPPSSAFEVPQECIPHAAKRVH